MDISSLKKYQSQVIVLLLFCAAGAHSLVANQKPAKIIELLTAHVKKHALPGVRVTVTPGRP